MQKQINKTALRSILALTLCSTPLLTAGCGKSGSSTPAAEAPAIVTMQTKLTTAQEVPAPTLPDAAATAPSGTASFTIYSTNKLRGSMTLTGFTLSGSPQATAVTGAHIHDGDVGAPGAVVKPLVADSDRVVWSLAPNTTLTDAQLARFKAGGYYVNAHTATNSGGVIRGQLISFASNIQPIFTANCVGCHVAGGSTPMSLAAGSAFGNLVDKPSTSALVPGGGIRVISDNSANSVLYKKISGTTAGPQMPLNNTPLGANDQNLIKVWIDMGAENN